MVYLWMAFSFVSLKLFGAPLYFVNGKILSSYSQGIKPVSEMLVDDGKVIRVGDHLEAPPNSKKIDLRGQFVGPALADSHVHLLMTGKERRQINLRGLDIKEIQKNLRDYLSKYPKTRALIGFGWDQNFFPEKKFPGKNDLDLISTKIPIILYRIDGHAAWVNTHALQISNLNNQSGIFVDSGLEQLESLHPISSPEELKEDIRKVVQEAHTLGITSIHDAGISQREYKLLKDLIREENLALRFYEMASATSEQELKLILQSGVEVDSLEGRLTRRSVKLFLDGALGSRGALFDRAYDDSPKERGIQLLSDKQFKDLVIEIDKKGFQVAVHAIGSKANRIAINTFEKIWGKKTASKRPRIEHAQVLDLPTINKMGELGIVASMQPTHCSSDSPWVITRIGERRARYAYAWHSLLGAKTIIAFGSDSPIESMNPWPGVFAALTRKNPNNLESDAFFPQEKLTINEALNAFTDGAAYSAFQENEWGSLMPGKWADFIVLEKDPFKAPPIDILNQKVLATYFSGKEVYRLKH